MESLASENLCYGATNNISPSCLNSGSKPNENNALTEGIQDIPLRFTSFSLVCCVLCSSKHIPKNLPPIMFAVIRNWRARSKGCVIVDVWRDKHVLNFYTNIYCYYNEHADELLQPLQHTPNIPVGYYFVVSRSLFFPPLLYLLLVDAMYLRRWPDINPGFYRSVTV